MSPPATSPFIEWLTRLTTHTESVQDTAPSNTTADRASALPILREAYQRHALTVAGPTLPFREETAWAATVYLANACWMLVNDMHEGKLPPLAVRRPTAADHLAVDCLLRHLPSVYRRARTRETCQALTAELQSMLRAWPLSGVLADLDGEPSTSLDFEGHAGLQLLYAERLVKTARVGWVPPNGMAREWAERVFQERGQSLPAPPERQEQERE